MLISDTMFTVFDTETTGLDHQTGDRIIEIAGVRVEGGVVREEKKFHSLVNPQRPVSRGAARVNRISESDLSGAPTIDTVLPAFLEFVGDSILVAHNADFDLQFLHAEKEGCWGYIDIPDCFCTLAMSRAVSPSEYRHNLDAVAQRLNISASFDERHRALADAKVTANVFLALLTMGNITTIDQLRSIATPAAKSRMRTI